jgi:hypothetical protein
LKEESLALATFLQLFRPQALDRDHTARVYRAHVDAVCQRVREIFDGWVTQREVEPDYARLANAAAVNRWELMRLKKRADRLHPPRTLNRAHDDLLTAVTASARACQLLANGYRFHKSEAICDGQALFVETIDELDALQRDVAVL